MTCAECEYDLRGLPPESVCPECGRSIAESAAAGPVTAWLPSFRRGVLFLGIGLLAIPFAESAVTARTFRVGEAMVNADGLLYLTHALLLLPAAWWLTKPAPFLRRDPHRLRRWLLALTVAQLLAAVLAFSIFHSRAYVGHVVLLSTYALAPLPYVVQLWLLLILLGRPLDLMPNALPRWLVRVVRGITVYSILAPALLMALVNFARIHYIDHPLPRGGTFLPEPLNATLYRYVAHPAYRVQRVAWVANLLVVLYCLFRLRRGVGLSRSRFAGGVRFR